MLRTGEHLSKPEIAAAYAALGERRGLGEKFRSRVLELAGDLGSKKVLDVGCGYGELLSQAASAYQDAEFFGIDYSPERVKESGLARVKTQRVDIEEERFPFEDAFFDVIFCTEVLEHLREPAGCFREIRRVLKTGGRAIFTVPNGDGFFPFNRFPGIVPGRWLRSKLLPYEHPENTDQPVDTCFEYEEIIGLIKGGGFSVEKISGWRYFRYLQMLPVFRIFYGLLEAPLEAFMNRFGSKRYAYNLFLVCSKSDGA